MSVAYVYVRNTKPSRHNQWNTNHGWDDTQHQKCSQARNKKMALADRTILPLITAKWNIIDIH